MPGVPRPRRVPGARRLGQHTRGVVSFRLRTLAREGRMNSHHRTAGFAGHTWRRSSRVAARGARTAVGDADPECGKTMRLESSEPNIHYANLDQLKFVCDCGQTTEKIVAH